ncbi:hypothetical protein BJ741DRAFT_593339 [Chytriomyces cf. hyalinus JEL632]|nr:hypothetical protein BJ741DRAFT_593339 [Chytriomyces cf. hyalinus JEL632]
MCACYFFGVVALAVMLRYSSGTRCARMTGGPTPRTFCPFACGTYPRFLTANPAITSTRFERNKFAVSSFPLTFTTVSRYAKNYLVPQFQNSNPQCKSKNSHRPRDPWYPDICWPHRLCLEYPACIRCWQRCGRNCVREREKLCMSMRGSAAMTTMFDAAKSTESRTEVTFICWGRWMGETYFVL